MEWLKNIVPGFAPDGSDILSVLGKQTYKFENGGIAEPDPGEQIPWVEGDEYWGDGNPAVDATKLESDLVAYKPMTDIVLIGKARPPRGSKVPQLSVGIQVGTARKVIQVIGNRKIFVTGTNIVISNPEPFDEMPLDYSRAYGGKDEASEEGTIYVYPRNPIGKGFIIKHNPQALQALVLPNLELPEKLLTPQNLVLGNFDRWKLYPEPASFGYQSKNFHPRYTLAGLPPSSHSDAEVDRQMALLKMSEVGTPKSQQPQPVMPMMNVEFFNGASPGLRLPYLSGEESILLANLDATFPRFSFKLPGIRPRAWIDVGAGPETMSMVLHTVVIYKETNQVSLVWRGCVKYGGLASMEKFTTFEFGVES